MGKLSFFVRLYGNSLDIVKKLCLGFQYGIRLSKSVRTRGFSIEFDGWNPRHNFHGSFLWEIIDNTGISCGASDLGSENSTCLDGDECSLALGSMLTNVKRVEACVSSAVVVVVIVDVIDLLLLLSFVPRVVLLNR